MTSISGFEIRTNLRLVVVAAVLSVAAFTPGALDAQAIPLPAADVISPACAAPEHRQFDFWLGEWSVGAAGREPLAENYITREAQGCFIRESYHNAGGYTGSSVNWYDRQTAQWNQLWVDNGGLVLKLTGGADREGRMVLSGSRVDGDGASVIDRITWSDLGDGTVRQHWQSSADGGESWDTAFDGIYRPLQP